MLNNHLFNVEVVQSMWLQHYLPAGLLAHLEYSLASLTVPNINMDTIILTNVIFFATCIIECVPGFGSWQNMMVIAHAKWLTVKGWCLHNVVSSGVEQMVSYPWSLPQVSSWFAVGVFLGGLLPYPLCLYNKGVPSLIADVFRCLLSGLWFVFWWSTHWFCLGVSSVIPDPVPPHPL